MVPKEQSNDRKTTSSDRDKRQNPIKPENLDALMQVGMAAGNNLDVDEPLLVNPEPNRNRREK